MADGTGTRQARATFSGSRAEYSMKSILLWALGVPITVIILLNVFNIL
jgi:hypothetical protein